MATIHKLDIKASLNGYQFSVKDVTGFGENGYSVDSLNVNNVTAIVLVLKNSNGNIENSVRLEGSEKNNFMTGLSEVLISSPETSRGYIQFAPDLYTVESYLINKVVSVSGIANKSEVTGTGLDAALEDNFIIDDTLVYEVDPTYTNGGTVLQLRSTIKRFFNQGSFGFKFEHRAVNYVKILKTLYKLSCMSHKALQKDGEGENFAVLTGHLNVIRWCEETGDQSTLLLVMRNSNTLVNHLNLRYFKL